MAGIADMLIGGFESGNRLRQQRDAEQKQRGLASLFSQAYASGNPREMLPQIAAIDPDAATKAQGSFEAFDDAQGRDFAETSQYFVNATPEQRMQMWPGIRADLSKRIPQAQYPEQWDESLLPQAKEIASLVAQRYGGSANNVQSRFVNERGEVMALLRDGTVINTGQRADPQRWLRDHPGMSPQVVDEFGTVNGVGQPSAAPGSGDPFAFLSQAGIPINSAQRTPQRNAEVGGVPNSYHLTGQARDIPPPRDPQQAAFIRQQAAANGLEVIDEGDHWHLEPRGGGAVAPARPSEAQVAAEQEAAKRRVGLEFAPAEAQAEAGRTRAVESAKADVEREAAAPKRTAKAKFEIDRATRVESAIDRALGQADWNATGLMGGALSGIPGTDAYNLARTVDEIKANIGFREIQTMRDNSPTGGALGQVAIQELQMLQATLGSLDQAQDGDQLRATLQRIKESMARWRQLQEAIASEGRDAAPSNSVATGGFRVLD